jgi:UDP-N-acetylmuramoylalanine--D-glutamate ligase
MSSSFYLIAGLGKTGHSIARYLQDRKKQFAVFDTRKQAPELDEFVATYPNAAVYLETIPDSALAQITDIIASPGLPLDMPLFQKAAACGIAIYGDIECLAQEINAPVIAITGTNGKSTVTTLVGEMAKASGMRVAVAGNIGTPVLELLGKPYDLWVLELSSFQLDLTHSLAPIAATILNVTPDHLDRHHTMEAYTQSKHSIYHNASSVLYNRDDVATYPQIKNLAILSFGKDIPTGKNWGLMTQDDEVFLARGSDAILPVSSLMIKGVHNWLNALAASALAESAHIPLRHIIDVLTTFPGLPHRCQWIRTLDGVEWINDSKGTNVGATYFAINGIGGAMPGKIVLIAGGQGKGASFEALLTPCKNYVRELVLIGEDAHQIGASLESVVPISHADSLESAVLVAQKTAKKGDVVLLSPACASFDMFRDFNHRGETFANIVSNL